ncbi:P-loop containing nucleoside triphosphate hydrolase protein [Cyathus striatus]|nr:P-loop containing nucleoside triphosphate hydrolase protein [Cyathus striatus]
MSTRPRGYCRYIIEGGCRLGPRCRFRHDIRKCSCGLVIRFRYWQPHIRGKRHRRELRAKKDREAARDHAADATGENAPEPVECCDECKKTLLASEMAGHVAEHARQKRLREVKAAQEEAERDKEGLVVTGLDGVDFGVLDPEVKKIEFMVAVTNNNEFNVALQSCRMRSSVQGDEPGKSFSVRLARLNGQQSKLIKPTQTRSLFVAFHPSYAGQYEDTIEILFAIPEPKKTFVITRRVTATVGSTEDYELLKASAPYSHRKATLSKISGEIVPSLRPATWTRTPWVDKLPEYNPPEALIEAAYGVLAQRSQRVAIQAIRRFMPETFNEHTYGKWFQVLLFVEEEKLRQDLEAYSLTDVELESDYPRYKLKVEGLAENRPSVLVGDFILVKKTDEPNGKWYEGRVHQVLLNQVSLRFGEGFHAFRGTTFDVRFKLNRLPYRRIHFALTNKFNPSRVLFPGPTHIEGLKRVTDEQRDGFVPMFRQLIGDEEQMETVAAIVNQAPGSVPFVVFGPPGTGKTVTIVEAMQQLLDRDPEVRILACAPSNSAADLIAMKLTNLGKTQVFRLNSLTRKIDDMPKSLRDFSLINENTVFAMPPVDTLRKYRVVVATCLSGGVPANLGIKAGHFTHIFIDEAGQGKEPEVMVPIKSNADEKTNIIIAGDNQQLGPIVHSGLANTLGLKTSYLSRIMERSIYELDTGRGITIVKLVKNFRSHPDILQFPNEQFYDSELQPCGDPIMTHSLENYEELPKKKFPIIFHGLIGRDERESRSPSFFNIDEVTQVKKYILALLDDRKKRLQANDIGVITPYHAQRCKILDVLRRDMRTRDIKVGSVEEFQGQERRIIIISTVRSNTHFIASDIRRSLGFVANERRFNVAITRAQAMLIVVGNPIVLSLDPLWRAFMNFIYRRGGWRGKQIDWDPEEPVDPDANFDAERRRKAEQNMDEHMLRIQSMIMQKHEDSDFEIDFGDDDDDEAGAFERPILREAE